MLAELNWWWMVSGSAFVIPVAARAILILFISSLAVNAREATVSQIHNAPGWLPNHAYKTGTRVNAGPGWDGTAFLSYRALNAYQVTSDCTSGTTAPTEIDPTVSDGTCIWKYLSATDYITLTGFANDNAPWEPRQYGSMDVVVAGSPLTAYQQTNPAGCTSTTAPPMQAKDGCAWSALAPITYTSGKSYLPTETFETTNSVKVNINHPYEALLWNDREYVIGQDGEVPLTFQGHNDLQNDSLIGRIVYPRGAGYLGVNNPIIINAAPGESFADTLAANPSSPLTGYNQANGVGIRGQIRMHDNVLRFKRLQFTSTSGPVLMMSARSCNECAVEYSIIDSVNLSVRFGAATLFDNDFFIVRGRNSIGTMFNYPMVLAHSTIVNPDGNGAACVETEWDWIFSGQYVIDTACFGFQHFALAWTNIPCPHWQCITWHGSNNFTDSHPAPVMAATPFVWERPGEAMYAYPVPSTSYGIPAEAVFRAWPGDYRLSATSPLRGAGAAFGPVNICPTKDNTQAASPALAPCLATVDSPDILGTRRPAKAPDVGAWQTPKK